VQLLLLNALVLLIVGTPLLLLKLLSARWPWLARNYFWFAFPLWFVILLLVYIFLLPRLGLEPSPEFFDPY
jgi:hypothetical protein